MALPRWSQRFLAFSRWHRAVLCMALLATLIAACSVLFDHTRDQCSTDRDCESFDIHPFCRAGVCVSSNLGPEGCFFGAPRTPEEFANQCTTASYEAFDNCERLKLCGPSDKLLEPTTPPMTVPPDASPIDAPPPPQLMDCFEPGRPTIMVGGSTAVQTFLTVVAPLLAAGSPPYQIVYQPSGSCTGVDQLFHPDPAKRVVKDIPGRPALLFRADGTGSDPCTLGPSGTALDVAVSDVFASSCTASYAPSDQLAEYPGPIQPMTFVVKLGSSERAISAEMAHIVFGRGGADAEADPYTDPTLFFVRNASSGTQQMISRAIDLDARRWWGIDRGGSGPVKDLLEGINPRRIDSAIGILSTDVADGERSRLRIVAFQAKGQLRAFYPDSSVNTRDKRNVRDGHYAIWGPVHFFTPVTNSTPSAAALALVNRFTVDRLDQSLLDKIISTGLVPPCAMKVKRDTEMGPLRAEDPAFQCGCYYESKVPEGKAPDSCKPCTGALDCGDKQACNLGFCERQP